MKNSETKPAIIVEGIVLTEETIEILKSCQESNNEGIVCCMESIANAICYITDSIDDFDGRESHNAIGIIKDLNSVRNLIKKLRKP